MSPKAVIHAWAFFDEGGRLLDITRTKPKKIRGGYQSAWQALGYKAEKVAIVKLRSRGEKP